MYLRNCIEFIAKTVGKREAKQIHLRGVYKRRILRRREKSFWSKVAIFFVKSDVFATGVKTHILI